MRDDFAAGRADRRGRERTTGAAGRENRRGWPAPGTGSAAGPDGRKLSAKQKLSKRGKPGNE